MADTLEELEKIAEVYAEIDPSRPESDFDYWLTLFGFERLELLLKGGKLCELGCSTGAMTTILLDNAEQLTVVEGSARNISIARERIVAVLGNKALEKVSLVHALWEDFAPGTELTDVIFAHGLEHVDRPVDLLTTIYAWMSRGSRLHVIVPNANSLHRRIGLAMGLLNDPRDLNERDVALGHQRVYDKDMLLRHISGAGFSTLHWDGIFLKPLSNGQMMAWDERLIRAFLEVGREMPDKCAEIYVCAEKQ